MFTRESSIQLSTRHTHCRNFHPGVTVDQAEGLCHRITQHFGRLNIETGALYYCVCICLKYWTVACFVSGW